MKLSSLFRRRDWTLDNRPPPPLVWPWVLAGAAGTAFLFALFWWAGIAAAMPLCIDQAERITCIVDGDTVWIEGEKIRLADIDAPEIEGKCPAENALAFTATMRLSELLAGEYLIRRGDPADGRQHDRYGRTLAVILVDGKSVGDVLVSEGLARTWKGRKARWC